MIKKHFYTHLIDTSVLSLELDGMGLSEEEKLRLVSLIYSNIHHEVLDLIMSELSDSDKKIFLVHLASENHDKVWNFLKGKIENVEEKIKKTADDIKNELHKDIKEVKLKKT